MDAAEPPRCMGGGARRVSLPEGQRLVVSGLSLVTDPAVALAPQQVHVWAEEAGHGVRALGTLSLENPIVSVRPPVELGGEFVLRHDSGWSTVRLYGYCVGRLNPEGEGEPTTTTGRRTHVVEDIHRAGEVLDEEVDMYVAEEEDVHEEWVEYEPLSEEDMAERYDSDNGEDDDEEEEEDRHRRKGGQQAAGESSKARNSIALVDAPPGGVAVPPDGDFLGPPRFAAVDNTAGFMRMIAGTGSQEGGNTNKEILVLYRYTRFSRTWSGRRGVEACRRTKLHWLRFALPPAAGDDMESALAWAGSSLAPLIYPRLFRRELGDLWSSLLAAAAPAAIDAIPPQATRLQVVVDAGILRREDYTAERMEHVRGALEAAAAGEQAWPEHYHVGMELRLPEPVLRRDKDDDARPAKRRRVVVVEEGEECSLCLDPMESGGLALAAWPGCRHVFHGECVELALAGKATCPLCRHPL